VATDAELIALLDTCLGHPNAFVATNTLGIRDITADFMSQLRGINRMSITHIYGLNSVYSIHVTDPFVSILPEQHEILIKHALSKGVNIHRSYNLRRIIFVVQKEEDQALNEIPLSRVLVGLL
jgi:hypothetical protein